MSSAPHPRRLQRIFLTLTDRCNLTCTYCYQDDKSSRSMDWDTLRAGLDLALASDEPDVEIVFFGGEPLLEWSNIRRAIDYVEARRTSDAIRYGLITNGTRITPEAVALLEEHDVDVQLSFDGVPQVQAERGSHTFDVLDRLLEDLHDRHRDWFRRRWTVSLTLVPSTVDHLADSVEYFLGRSVANLAISHAYTGLGDWDGGGLPRMQRQFDRVVRLSLDHWRRTGDIPVLSLRGQGGAIPDDARDITMCGVTRAQTPTLDVDGQLHGCGTFVTTSQSLDAGPLLEPVSRFGLGDVRDPHSLEAGHAEYADRLEDTGLFHRKEDKSSSYGECRSCEFLTSCSVCPMSIAQLPGNSDPNRVPDFLCAFNLALNRARTVFRDRTRVDLLRPTPSSNLQRLLAITGRTPPSTQG